MNESFDYNKLLETHNRSKSLMNKSTEDDKLLEELIKMNNNMDLLLNKINALEININPNLKRLNNISQRLYNLERLVKSNYNKILKKIEMFKSKTSNQNENISDYEKKRLELGQPSVKWPWDHEPSTILKNNETSEKSAYIRFN